MTEGSKLDAALSLARMGLRVFPLVENSKKPLIEGFPDRATTDEASINAWWGPCPVTGWQRDYNIGISTGRGLIVLDEDNKGEKTGAATLSVLTGANEPLPPTLVSETPTGGRHYLFRCDDDLRNSVENLGSGLDTRGHGGYVVAPGSTLPTGEYRWRDPAVAIAQLPAWLRERCKVKPAVQRVEPPGNVTLDTPANVARAVAYLEGDAPTATKGAGSDNQTYQIACRVRDFGVSQETCLRLMLDHWNETKSNPPWPIDRLEKKVENAYKYAENSAGTDSAKATFTPVYDSALQPRQVLEFRPENLPPRQWIIGKWAIRENVTVVVAPPGMGKSTFILLLMLSIASGRTLAGVPVRERCPVWYYNNEDPTDELQRRLAAAMQHHRVKWSELADETGHTRLYLNTGTQRPLVVAKRRPDKRPFATSDVDDMIGHIRRENIGVLVVDPLIETHELNENDNGEMRFVAAQYRRIAQETGCAVVIVHHTKKPSVGDSESFAGDMNSARGAGAVLGVARVGLTLYGLDKATAKKYSIPDHERKFFVRVDDAKGNMSLAANTLWLRRVSVPIGTPASEFAGSEPESVGTLEVTQLSLPLPSRRTTAEDFADGGQPKEPIGPVEPRTGRPLLSRDDLPMPTMADILKIAPIGTRATQASILRTYYRRSGSKLTEATAVDTLIEYFNRAFGPQRAIVSELCTIRRYDGGTDKARYKWVVLPPEDVFL